MNIRMKVKKSKERKWGNLADGAAWLSLPPIESDSKTLGRGSLLYSVLNVFSICPSMQQPGLICVSANIFMKQDVLLLILPFKIVDDSLSSPSCVIGELIIETLVERESNFCLRASSQGEGAQLNMVIWLQF